MGQGGGSPEEPEPASSGAGPDLSPQIPPPDSVQQASQRARGGAATGLSRHMSLVLTMAPGPGPVPVTA